ncbi:hypothetical protein EXIGLDRAFT_758204 [Exidia glandulosa HHB12029]|uniref:Uncharacterized protein n=1 Tax=Exidia glandulosa HHB12029 TaxID=1314781 RepID=A0A165QPG4_EXIGL|nr:hypothetical protein EXIGLDRAFT_758204 [Exidia glandulosa HHB12029]
MPILPDIYTRAQTRPMRAHARKTQAYPSPDASFESAPPAQEQHSPRLAPPAKLIAHLEQHVARTEKKWNWIATAFDDTFAPPSNDMSRDGSRCATAVKQRMPMADAANPFSLSALFYQLESPDSSGSTAQDTTADLSLYGWLSAQGAQTIIPGPPAAARRPLRPVSLPPIETTVGVTMPLSPPPTGQLPDASVFGLELQELPTKGVVGQLSSPLLVTPLDKPLPALPISPPCSPAAQFKDAEEDQEHPLHPCNTSSDLEDDSLEEGFDLDHALSRNLALQHMSTAAVRQYRLVVQELKYAVLSRPSTLPRSNSNSTVRFPRASTMVTTATLPLAASAREMVVEEHLTVEDAAQENSAREMAVLLSRQASEEELDAEHLRALAARLEEVARQRRVLATSVLRCS